jgi:hypothetical protein
MHKRESSAAWGREWNKRGWRGNKPKEATKRLDDRTNWCNLDDNENEKTMIYSGAHRALYTKKEV